MNLGNTAEADSGAESMSGNLCAEFGRDIVLNMSKRDEADSGLKHFSGDPCVVFGQNIRAMVVSKSAKKLISVLCLPSRSSPEWLGTVLVSRVDYL